MGSNESVKQARSSRGRQFVLDVGREHSRPIATVHFESDLEATWRALGSKSFVNSVKLTGIEVTAFQLDYSRKISKFILRCGYLSWSSSRVRFCFKNNSSQFPGHGMVWYETGNFHSPYMPHSFHTITTVFRTIFDLFPYFISISPISHIMLYCWCVEILWRQHYNYFGWNYPFKQPWCVNFIPNLFVSYRRDILSIIFRLSVCPLYRPVVMKWNGGLAVWSAWLHSVVSRLDRIQFIDQQVRSAPFGLQ